MKVIGVVDIPRPFHKGFEEADEVILTEEKGRFVIRLPDNPGIKDKASSSIQTLDMYLREMRGNSRLDS